ncbi:MAG: DUF3775 domain-containing protein [Rhodomicrobium sp.]|nr:DUF3775 domain-containing protein [Rhodomicrobium sp.]
MLEISPEKVGYVILRAREADVKPEAWDEEGAAGPGDTESDTIPEDRPGDPARQELKEFLNRLNADEQASLIALAWIGRGTYAPAEIVEAVAAAKAEHGGNASVYLFKLPLLPDYLEDALDQLGISCGDAEGGILRPA